jgi:hypothetical protein
MPICRPHWHCYCVNSNTFHEVDAFFLTRSYQLTWMKALTATAGTLLEQPYQVIRSMRWTFIAYIGSVLIVK